MSCRCPALPERDLGCPEHGLATLRVPADLEVFAYPDGVRVHASSQAAADAMYARVMLQRVRACAVKSPVDAEPPEGADAAASRGGAS